MQIDETDTRLLAELGANARLPLATLARRLGLARSTLQARLERLERTGVIAGYTVVVGTPIRPRLRATALISVEPRAAAGVIQRLGSLSTVEQVHTTSGRFDLIATLVAETTEALDATLDRIGETRGVRGSESLIHLSTKIDRRGAPAGFTEGIVER